MMSKCLVGLVLVGLTWCAVGSLIGTVSAIEISPDCDHLAWPGEECQGCCAEKSQVGVPFKNDRNHCLCMYASKTPSYGFELAMELKETSEEEKACDSLPKPSDKDGRCRFCCGRRFMDAQETILGKCKCVKEYKIKHHPDGSPYAVPMTSVWGRLAGGGGGGAGGFGAGGMSAAGVI